jgi:peptide chain release factor 2
MITADQLKDIKERTEALYRYLGIEQKRVEVEEEELRTQAPDFWEDAKAAEAQMKKVKDIRKWLDGYDEVKTACDELELAFDYYKELVQSYRRLKDDLDFAKLEDYIDIMQSRTDFYGILQREIF